MTNGPVTQGNYAGSTSLQQPTWLGALQQPETSSSLQQPQIPQAQGQIGVSGLAQGSSSSTVTVSTSTGALPQGFSQVQTTETTSLTPTSFTVPTWVWYAGGAILLIVVASFLISAFKQK